jgi:glycosyltransferase involved in cell wall biosynthesis
MLGTRGVPATYGGVEHQVEEVGRRLVERGHHVTVFCRPGYSEAALDAAGANTGDGAPAAYRGMHLRHLPTIGTKHLEALVHTGLSTAVALRGFDVTHYHCVGPGVLGVVPRLLGTSGVVLTVHGLNVERRSKWGPTARAALRWAERLSRRAPNVVVTVSRMLTERYREEGCAARYVPNASRELTPRPPDRIRRELGLAGGDYFLYLGRFVPEKGPDLLLQAFRRVRGDVRLVMAGGGSHSGPYLDELRELAAGDERIVFPGYVYGELLEELLTNPAAFVAPSRTEGLPLTLLEAIQVGAPVVASDIPAHREVLHHDGPGRRLVPAEDPAALAAALQRVLGGAEEEVAGVPELRERVTREYSWDRIVDDLEEIYLQVAARQRSATPAR